jgi:Mce-associated membrane protein
MADADEQPQDSAKAKADAIALAEQAEAEAAEAEALAAAARARARAIKLRREAQAEGEGEDESAAQATTQVVDAADATAETSQTPQTVETIETSEPFESPAASTESARRRLLASRLSRILTAATIIVTCGLLGVSGWMVWHHHHVAAERQRSAAFTAAAKQGVINLTSLDFTKAKEDVQRVLDSSTGEFRDDFQRRADDFASVVQDSKAVTEGSVAATAVESMSKDSAVVLILANERITNSTGAKDEPRSFRFRVSVIRDGDQMKISKVEFVL